MKAFNNLRQTFLFSKILGLAPIIITDDRCKKLGYLKICNYSLLLINIFSTLIACMCLGFLMNNSYIVFFIEVSDIAISVTISSFGVFLVLKDDDSILKVINRIQTHTNQQFLLKTKKLYLTSCLIKFYGILSYIIITISAAILGFKFEKNIVAGIANALSAILLFRVFKVLPLQYFSLVLVIGTCWANINQKICRMNYKISAMQNRKFLKKLKRLRLAAEDLINILEEVNKIYIKIMFMFCLTLFIEWIYIIISLLLKEKLIFAVVLKMISLSIYLIICVAVCDFTSNQVS